MGDDHQLGAPTPNSGGKIGVKRGMKSEKKTGKQTFLVLKNRGSAAKRGVSIPSASYS